MTYSKEARPYSQLIFFTTLTTALYVRATYRLSTIVGNAADGR
jgi:hypothetical protein